MYTPSTSNTMRDPVLTAGRIALCGVAIAIVALLAALLTGPGAAEAQSGPHRALTIQPDDVLAGVEVAEDGTRFVFDENGPLHDTGLPAYGNGFVTQGYIYPAGTLDEHNGIHPDGSPEFPEKVLGTWTCWGYFIGDGAETVGEPWVITTQVFDFDAAHPGAESIVTVGVESPAGAGEVTRAITGGTGRYAFARGQVTQVTLGHNASDGVNATVELRFDGRHPHVVPATYPSRLR